jgi:hypothetical protein
MIEYLVKLPIIGQTDFYRQVLAEVDTETKPVNQ